VGHAVDHRQVLARDRLVDLVQHAVLERRVEVLQRVVAVARVVLAQPERQLLGGTLAQGRLGDLRRDLRRLRVATQLGQLRAGGQEQGGCERRRKRALHWKRWRTVISSRVFNSRFSTCAGNVVLRISTLYLPGSSLSDFIGGTTPRDLP